ncbi:HNH endonuclease [Pseudomonas monteilii]|uniref:HNH endonuclease n=1 Tax=Pseudomonas monteilii TaxID=76759 RepID=UPI0038112A4E
MGRPDIPAEIRRAVLVEAGHRCAIPRCHQTELDVHHIVPWADCQKHEYSNLIALCPICHRRAHLGDIDKKSLFIYKENLAKEFGRHDNGSFQAEAVEIKRRLKDSNVSTPGFQFQFDFPDFPNPVERIVSRNIEAWGLELLADLQDGQVHWDNHLAELPEIFHNCPAQLFGNYEITRRDERVISIRYTIDHYYPGAAHGGRETRVLNYTLSPFRPVTLEYLLGDLIRLPPLADLVRKRLYETGKYTDHNLNSGTEPIEEKFSLFIINQYGITFIFSEYSIASYAEGEQTIFVDFRDLNPICDAQALESLYMRER